MKNKAINTVVFCLILLYNLNGIAQVGDQNDTGNLENQDVPINDYIITMLLIGIVIGYRLLKQKKLIAK